MATKIKWYGKEFTAKLYRKVDNKIENGANKIMNTAKNIVPKDSGALASSINTVKVKNMEYRVQSDLEYALMVEFGTSRMSPKPYFRPAMNRLNRI